VTSKDDKPGPGHLRALTGLRFLAAIHVVAFHFGQRWFPGVVRGLITGGYTAVSLFFVLSGFVLAYSYLGRGAGGPLDKRDFWAARVARVYPLHLLALFVMLPLIGFAEAGGSWFGCTSVVLLLQSWIPGLAMTWNTPAWSLSVEVFFYFIFPWLLPRLERLATRTFLPAFAGTYLVGLVFPSLAAFLWDWPRGGAEGAPLPSPAIVDFVRATPLWHLPTFLLGALLGARFVRRSPAQATAEPRPWVLVTLGGGGLLLALAVFARFIPDPYLHDGALAPLQAMLIYGLASGEGSLARLLSSPAMVLLGEASYATYLLHVPLQRWVRLAWERLGFAPGSPAFAAVFLVVLLAASVLVFKTFEDVARRRVRRWLTGPRRQAPDVGALARGPSRSR